MNIRYIRNMTMEQSLEWYERLAPEERDKFWKAVKQLPREDQFDIYKMVGQWIAPRLNLIRAFLERKKEPIRTPFFRIIFYSFSSRLTKTKRRLL